MYTNILFIDFDGTITAEETLEGIMQRYIPEEMFKQGMKEIMSGEKTLKETVHYAFSTIPSSRYEDIMSYVRGVPIRPGFDELVTGMQKLGIPVVVISGGLKPYVDEKLAPYRDRILDVYSVELDLEGAFMKLHTAYGGVDDLLEKLKVMALYDYEQAICIGDSLTDLRMAMHSDVIFARDRLAELLSERTVPYMPWQDFHDVYKGIKELAKVQ